MPDEQANPYLNIFEVETEGGTKHFVGFIDPELAEARGIDSRCLIGEFEPMPDGEFDVHTFVANPEFLAAFVAYMNDGPIRAEDVIEYASTHPGEPLYIVDPRNMSNPEEEPPDHDVMGLFQVDPDGQVIPNSFQYHEKYEWFSISSGTSGLLEDPRFYEWMHKQDA